jgi:acyl-CoA thioesterase-1
MNAVLVVSLLAAGISHGSAAAERSEAGSVRTVLVLGDSISAGYGIQRDHGWVALLSTRLNESDQQFNVVNASISGETTGGGLARLPLALKTHEPDVVIVELGGNDGLRGYPLAQIRANLERIGVLSQTAGAELVFLGMRIPPNYGARYANAFHRVFAEVAEAFDAPLTPFLLEGVALTPGMMQSDGVHPTRVAQPLLLDNAWAALSQLI